MRVVVVVAAMFFCMTGCSRNGINSIGIELIEIPAGKFTMGGPEGENGVSPASDTFSIVYDEAQVSVKLTKSFGLGKTEVTQGQWKKVMDTEPWKGNDFVKADEDCPALCLDWDDATEFCEKLTKLERKSGILKVNEEYRLPTEAEWEYACRAGTKKAFSFGDDKKQLGEYAWFVGNANDVVGERYAHKVGIKKPNPWGLYDMHGNASEWCSDGYKKELSGGTDPVGPNVGSYRVNRGGHWGQGPGRCRSACRGMDVPAYRAEHLGFRVARSQSAQ